MLANMQFFAPLNEIIKTYLNNEQIKNVKEAYAFSYFAHDGQLRSSGEPYITHPVEVALILASLQLEPKAIIAALLHDTIEDTAVTYQDIATKFGDDIALLVDGVSKLDKLKFRNRQEAQVENFRKMILAMGKDVRVILIKLADRLHNMRTLNSLRVDKRRRIAKETLEIYTPLAHRLGIHDIKSELEILGFKALYPIRARIIQKTIDLARKNKEKLISQIVFDIKTHLDISSIPVKIDITEKNIYEIYQQMRQHEHKFYSIMDIIIFKVIVENTDYCYRSLGVLHNLYKPKLNRFKDFIAIPKINGYQALHTSLIGPHGSPVKVQISTNDMNKIAEMGVVARYIYNQENNYSQTVAQIKTESWINNVIELQKNTGNTYEFIENFKTDLFPKSVYLFTPKGKIIELPKGATPIDMAYAIHSDIGFHCFGAIVDRKPFPLSEPLSNGQTVEIITSKQSKPKKIWLQFVVSAKARANIKQAIKSIEDSDAIKLGYLLLNNLLVDQGGIESLTSSTKNNLIEKTKKELFQDILLDLGLGKISQSFLAKILNQDIQKLTNIQKENKLIISGNGDEVMSLAKCCHPVYGDPIIGKLDQHKGLFVHHESCKNVRDNNEQIVSLMWSSNPTQQFIAELSINIINNTAHALTNIILAIRDESANVHSINMLEIEPSIHQIIIQLDVKDLQQLVNIIKKISHQPDVINVNRNVN